MGDLLKKLAIVYGVLGGIGTFVIAYYAGRTASFSTYSYRISYDRDWVMTFAVFFGVALSVVMITAALYALGEIYDTVKSINFKATPVESKHIPQEAKEKQDNDLIKNGGWKCPKCGKVNHDYDSRCSCGNSRYADMN